MRRVGRKQKYTVEEIKQLKCQCGKRCVYQWNCCANDNRWVGLCKDCDIALNEMVLAFFRVPGRDKLMIKYRRKLGR